MTESPLRDQLKPLEVAAGLVFRDGRLLITQRRPEDHLGGLWEFPGGKREANETWEECLHRELLEELGIEVDLVDLCATVTHAYPEKTVRLQFFRCLWREHEPQTLGCHAFDWVSAHQLARFQFPPADQPLIRQLATSKELWL